MSERSFEGVVTPEAVVLEFDTAGVGSRFAAGGIDWMIRTAGGSFVLIAGGVLDGWVGPVPSWFAVTLLTLVLFFFVIAYPAFFETVWSGKTPGKAFFGLRVVTVEGAPIRFRHAAIRAALAFFEESMTFGAPAAVAIFLSRRDQRLGDMVAGTLVLRERMAHSEPVATSFLAPHGAEEYVASLDVSILRSEEYLTIRSYLLRAPKLSPAGRLALGEQLGRRFATRLGATPPQSMPAEVFLLCVAAAYQRRFSG